MSTTAISRSWPRPLKSKAGDWPEISDRARPVQTAQTSNYPNQYSKKHYITTTVDKAYSNSI